MDSDRQNTQTETARKKENMKRQKGRSKSDKKKSTEKKTRTEISKERKMIVLQYIYSVMSLIRIRKILSLFFPLKRGGLSKRRVLSVS